ncbi:phytoene desaturase family protein [Singulisphaera sp. Ch08]|uniref:Phytoene desaturase family protein n=1 Tax=Singulisphaera sp. Ch08 TaxID=3120278 RepID=A0AAU7C975_9BACT
MASHDSPRRVAVVGAGLGGLAAACTLAARGHAVTIFDRNEWAGGKADVLEEQGFRFDMGPTILTLPVVLRRIFEEAGRDFDQAVRLVRLDPEWRCFFEDGSTLDLCDDAERMAETLDRYAPGSKSGRRYQEFLEVSRRLHEISERFFFWRPIGSLGDMFRPGDSFNLGTLRDVMALRMGKTVSSTIRGFAPDARVAQMLDHFTQYVGSSPEQSPAVLCGIAHMQTRDGIWYPMGGTAAIPAALRGLATDLGVRFELGTGVRRIVTRDCQVRGVETDQGASHDFEAVVSNMDSVRTFRELIDGAAARKFERRGPFEPACSGVVLYLGLSKAYDHLLHHNFVFSRDPHQEFDAIYRKGEPAPDPTCYVCAPSRTDPSVAPGGGEALYILVHAPSLRPGQDWSVMLEDYKQVIYEKLARVAGLEDLRERIVVERHLTPQDIQDRYHVLDGAIYGLASHGRFLGAFKPGNRSPLVRGLYLAGGAAHPGPGMPMVLMSGWIAADALDRDVQEVEAPTGAGAIR